MAGADDEAIDQREHLYRFPPAAYLSIDPTWDPLRVQALLSKYG